MNSKESSTADHRLASALVMVFVMIAMQIFLMTLGLRAYANGDQALLFPLAITSLGCFALVAPITWWTLNPPKVEADADEEKPSA